MIAIDVFNKAAKELPDGFDIFIQLQRSSGTVRLESPDGDDLEFCHDGTIEQQILWAIEEAHRFAGV